MNGSRADRHGSVAIMRLQHLLRSGSVQHVHTLGESLAPTGDAGLLAYYGGALMVTGRDWNRGFHLIARAHAARAEAAQKTEASAWLPLAAGFCEAMLHGDFPRAERWLTPTRDDDPMAVHLNMNRSVVLALAGKPERSLRLIESIEDAAEHAGSRFHAQGLELTRAMCHLALDDMEGVRRSLDALPAEEVSAQLLPWRHRVALLRHLHLENLAAAESARQRMTQALAPFAHGLYSPECRLAESLLLLRQERHDDAIAVLSGLLAFCQRHALRFWEMRTHQLLAACFLDRGWGFTGESRRHLGHALRLSRRGGYDAIWSRDPLGISHRLLADSVRLKLHEKCTARLRSRAEYPVSTVMPRLAAHAFGGPRVVKDGVPVPIRSRRVHQLLAWLLARGGQAVPAAAVIDHLWPEVSVRRGKNNLARLLFDLRQAVWPECPEPQFLIAHEVDFLQFQPGIALDVVQHSRLLAQADGLHARGRTAQAIPLYERALTLCDAPFLEAYPDEALPGQAAGIEAARQRIVGILASQALAEGRPEQAEAWCRRQIARDPGDEAALRTLLQSLAAQGMKACAIRALCEVRCRLQRDLALDLSPATLDVAERLLGATSSCRGAVLTLASAGSAERARVRALCHG